MVWENYSVHPLGGRFQSRKPLCNCVHLSLFTVKLPFLGLTRTPQLKWLGCVKMLEQKRFGKIAGIPAWVW
jgi:hypothetical protein